MKDEIMMMCDSTLKELGLEQGLENVTDELCLNSLIEGARTICDWK